jgi:hypothetical protein
MMIEAAKPIFLLMHIFFADPSSNMIVGEFHNLNSCVSAKVNSNQELRPDATTCVPVDAHKYVQIMREKSEFSLMLASKNPKD